MSNFLSKGLIIFGVIFSVAGCGTIRDGAVYATEIQFEDMAVRHAAPAVRAQLLGSCSCTMTGDQPVWTSTVPSVSADTCSADADWYRTYVGRWAWHIAIQRHNGNVSGAIDPGAVPPIVHTCDVPEAPNEIAAPAPAPTSGGSQ
jgi:hypothetical protein